MKIKNEQELIEAMKELYSLKVLEDELEEKIMEINRDIHEYFKGTKDNSEQP